MRGVKANTCGLAIGRTPVHPRMRGVKGVVSHSINAVVGTSPHARGGHDV